MRSQDEPSMRRALELARRGLGLASPNPMVGAVLVRDGQVVGEGFHRYEEKKHAEVWALEQAGERACGSTLYVTLEPCSHQGRTPPCANQVIQAGIVRVVAAMQDPNPLVAGQGFASIRASGIAVEVGPGQAEALKLNEAYVKFIQTDRPFVTLKAAMTLDGKVAQENGVSRWITGQPARDKVQQLRFASDALLSGIGTILADDPLLTDRTAQARRRPLLRVVLDTALRLPLESRILGSSPNDVLVFCAEECNTERRSRLEKAGVEIVPVPVSRDGLDLVSVFEELGRRQITSVLIEAGPRLNLQAARSGCVDKLLCFLAPKLLGGQAPLPMLGNPGFGELGNAWRVRFESAELVGEDLLIEAYVDRTA